MIFVDHKIRNDLKKIISLSDPSDSCLFWTTFGVITSTFKKIHKKYTMRLYMCMCLCRFSLSPSLTQMCNCHSKAKSMQQTFVSFTGISMNNNDSSLIWFWPILQVMSFLQTDYMNLQGLISSQMGYLNWNVTHLVPYITVAYSMSLPQ